MSGCPQYLKTRKLQPCHSPACRTLGTGPENSWLRDVRSLYGRVSTAHPRKIWKGGFLSKAVTVKAMIWFVEQLKKVKLVAGRAQSVTEKWRENDGYLWKRQDSSRKEDGEVAKNNPTCLVGTVMCINSVIVKWSTGEKSNLKYFGGNPCCNWTDNSEQNCTDGNDVKHGLYVVRRSLFLLVFAGIKHPSSASKGAVLIDV